MKLYECKTVKNFYNVHISAFHRNNFLLYVYILMSSQSKSTSYGYVLYF